MFRKRLSSILFAALFCFSFVLGTAVPNMNTEYFSASAVSSDYPAQLMNLATKDNSKVLTENGTADNSSLSVKALGSDLSPSWRFDRVNVDANGTFFKIVNAQSGRLLTPKGYSVKAGSEVVVYGSESDKSQHWYVVPVKNDHFGNGLYYKIVNYSNTSLALTQGTSGATLANYSGADNQLWLLNPDGLQGFAGYCKNDNTNNIKAADIGGLFGEVVEATSFDKLKEYATSDKPYTIVVTKNITVTTLNLNKDRYMCTAGRIYVHDNKTIIGSYGAHTLYNVQFCTSSSSGVGNNIIIKNFEMQHDAESNNNDSIQVYFGSGKNLWVDHVTFPGHSNYGYAPKTGLVDEDKFLACCYDADYCTVSDSSFGGHKYGLILGYPDSSSSNADKYDGFPNMTIAGNYFNDTNTRAPGLMRWGYYHSMNNYVNKFSMAYTVQANCRIYAENCNYTNGGNVICDWNLSSGELAGSFAESGSAFDSSCGRTVQGQGTTNNPSHSKACTWRPTTNYSYVKLTADKAKSYCTSYSGCQNSSGNMMYLRYGSKGNPSAGFTEAPSGTSAPVPEEFVNGSTYRIKNKNSQLYMQVEGAKAVNGTNVQQWGTSDDYIHDIWKLIDAGDGYYNIVSAVGDGGTYLLDVAGKRTDNGTNIDIYQSNGGDNQKFMFTKNADGTYKIRTKITGGKSAVEIVNAGTGSGDNVQQYEINGNSCQDWELEPVTNPGCKMDTSVNYVFKNVLSNYVMDIADGKMEAGNNVRQWGENGANCQKWTLKEYKGGGNYYYIHSVENPNYVLKANGNANGGNINIAEFTGNNDSSMLFKFSKNPDGTYYIMTRASKDARLVEVESGLTDEGRNIQQWQPTNHNCQKWNAVTITTSAATTPTATTTTTAKATDTTTTASSTGANTTQNTSTSSNVTTPSTTTTTTTTESPDKIIGDLNEDNEVNVSDVVLLQKFLVQKVDKISGPADLNKDEKVNVFDLMILKRIVINRK